MLYLLCYTRCLRYILLFANKQLLFRIGKALYIQRTMAAEVPHYTIRPMKREEIKDVLQLWRETGLAEGTYSLDTWFAYQPEGFYVAVTDDGMVLGALAGLLQHEDLVFLGLYVVKSAYRGHGVGRKIWSTIMKRVGDRNAGLNPVPEQLTNYRDRSGFSVQTSWCSVVSITSSMDMALFTVNDLEINTQRLTLEDNDTLNNVISYDADVCGFSRGNLVPLLCNQKDSVTIVAITADSSEICGYGNIRKNIKNGAIVGPLYADSSEIAERILYELIKAFPIGETEGIMMMAINCNRPSMKMMDKLGFPREKCIARLYRKEEVHAKYEKIFSQHSLNFSVF